MYRWIAITSTMICMVFLPVQPSHAQDVESEHYSIKNERKGEGLAIFSHTIETTSLAEYFTSGDKEQQYSKTEDSIYMSYRLPSNLSFGLYSTQQRFNIDNSFAASSLPQPDMNNVDDIESKMQDYLESMNITRSDLEGYTLEERQALYDAQVDAFASQRVKLNTGYSEFFLQKRFFKSGDTAMYVRGMYKTDFSDGEDITNLVEYSNKKEAFELRYKIDTTFQFSQKKNSVFYNQYQYFSTELAYRKIFDNFFDEIRLDTTLSIRVNPNSFMLFQVFITKDVNSANNASISFSQSNLDNETLDDMDAAAIGMRSSDNKFLRTDNNKFQISSITNFSNDLSFQLAFIYTIPKIGERTQAVQVGMWRKF